VVKRRQRSAPTAHRPIRVLLVIKSLGFGGAERLVVGLVAAGNKAEFEYEVAYLLEYEDSLAPVLSAGGTPTHPLGASHNLNFRWMARFRRLLLAGHYDIVHFHLPYPAALGRPVIRSLPPRLRPVTLYTEHSLWNKVSPLIKLLNRTTIGYDRSLITVSQAAHDALPRSLQARSRVVVHGIDLSESEEMVGRRPEIARSVQAELDVPADDLLVVTVANLRSEKGYDVLLDTARLVVDRGLPVRFVAAGQGPLEQELTDRHAALHLGDRFRFLGHRHDALALLTAADVFVLPSHQEGLPVALMEAASVGTAIVATAVGGVPQVITDQVNGLIVPPGSPVALADALERLCADPGLRHRLGDRALVDSAAFDMTRASGEIEHIYRALLDIGP
jgi:glycosyltransferase involved in cell wall biosynthesis